MFSLTLGYPQTHVSMTYMHIQLVIFAPLLMYVKQWLAVVQNLVVQCNAI